MLHYYPISTSFRTHTGGRGISHEVRAEAFGGQGASRYVCNADSYESAEEIAFQMNRNEVRSCQTAIEEAPLRLFELACD